MGVLRIITDRDIMLLLVFHGDHDLVMTLNVWISVIACRYIGDFMDGNAQLVVHKEPGFLVVQDHTVRLVDFQRMDDVVLGIKIE